MMGETVNERDTRDARRPQCFCEPITEHLDWLNLSARADHYSKVHVNILMNIRTFDEFVICYHFLRWILK